MTDCELRRKRSLYTKNHSEHTTAYVFCSSISNVFSEIQVYPLPYVDITSVLAKNRPNFVRSVFVNIFCA